MQTEHRSQKIAVTGATGRVGAPLVEILEQRGHDVVPIARSQGIDVVSGEGLDDALAGAETIIDTATGPSPDQTAATEFFTASARNLQRAGARAGARRIVVVSIIGIDKFQGGYNAAKVAQEQSLLEGPLPVQIVRAAQFHEFVDQLVGWMIQDGVAYLPEMQRSSWPLVSSPRLSLKRPRSRRSRTAGSPRSPARRRSASPMRPPRSSPPAATRSRSARAASPAIRTPRPMRKVPRCPTRARRSPAPALRVARGGLLVRMSAVTIRRAVPNISSDQPAETREFFVDLLGFEVAMDLGWVVTLASPTNPTAQVTIISNDDPAAPGISVGVDDVDAVHARAVELGLEIVYPLRDEEWGVRRFMLREPSGTTVNIVSHRPD